MTHEDIVYDRRVRLINYAAEIGNVTRACRVFGVSRKTYYQWLAKAEQYGLSALLPKERRTPHQPNAMSMEEVSVILAEAVARPTLGARSLLRHLHARGVHRSASGVAKVLHRHNLGTARLRVAALASLTAADSGQVTDAAMEGPFGFCLFASRPGQVVSLDTFYVGRLKGVGAVWQLHDRPVARHPVPRDQPVHARDPVRPAARWRRHLHAVAGVEAEHLPDPPRLLVHERAQDHDRRVKSRWHRRDAGPRWFLPSAANGTGRRFAAP